jgi:hypothetical protein
MCYRALWFIFVKVVKIIYELLKYQIDHFTLFCRGICASGVNFIVTSVIFGYFTFLLKLFKEPLPWIWTQNYLIKALWKGKSERRKKRESLQQMFLGQSLKLVGLCRIMRFFIVTGKTGLVLKTMKNFREFYIMDFKMTLKFLTC